MRAWLFVVGSRGKHHAVGRKSEVARVEPVREKSKMIGERTAAAVAATTTTALTDYLKVGAQAAAKTLGTEVVEQGKRLASWLREHLNVMAISLRSGNRPRFGAESHPAGSRVGRWILGSGDAIVALTTGALVCAPALADDGATKPYFSSAVAGWDNLDRGDFIPVPGSPTPFYRSHVLRPVRNP